MKKSNNGYDTRSNRNSKIAIKVMGPILWIILIAIFFVAIFDQKNHTEKLEETLTTQSDHFAFNASRIMNKQANSSEINLADELAQLLNKTHFVYGEINNGNNRIKFGEKQEDLVHIQLPVPLQSTSNDNNSTLVSIDLYHPEQEILINNMRKRILVKVSIPLLVFGIILSTLMHIVVSKPIYELVNATKVISKGDISFRIKTQRQDELGHLAKFFNEMLDTLQSKQNDLGKAVTTAQSANETKSLFLANMSHEIRTPLTAIIGYSHMLTKTQIDPLDREQIVEPIIHSGKLLQDIINDILDLSKIEAGQLLIENVATYPFEIINEIVKLIEIRTQEKGLFFSTKYHYPLPKVIYTDPTRIKQILLNICSNAIKFTSKGKILFTIDYLENKQQMQFTVTDEGIGMSEQELQKIFKPFSQADSSTTRRFGGTGLGLFISKQLAEKLSGDICCVSSSGAGSRFTVTIATGDLTGVEMLTTSPEKTQQFNTPSESAVPNLLSSNILLAEDSLLNQRLIKKIIQKTGANVTVVENGKEAVDRVAEQDFDLIIMDMQMPIMDGPEATTLLRKSGYSKPIIALTANAMKEDRDKCLLAGTDEYLTKPLEIDKFYSVLSKLLVNNTTTC